MDREIASTAPISQPLQYMMVTTRQTMPARGTAEVCLGLSLSTRS